MTSAHGNTPNPRMAKHLTVWSPDDLDAADRELLREAHEAASKAYAPYSLFQVGGAVRLEDGTVVRGSNQENIAYPSGMCGERVAVFAAGAQHPGAVMRAVAIVSPSPKAIADAFMPCGGAVRFSSRRSADRGNACASFFRSATRP